jgi:tRNA dimethylallyltransferase
VARATGGAAPAPPAAVLVLTGPTAVGKSELGLEVARALGAEIVSADSAMVYRGLDIGTAKPSAAERAAVPHHLLDLREPEEPFSLAEYLPLAQEALRAVAARGRVPLLVGGTGLYLRHLLEGSSLPPVAPQPALRQALERRARERGAAALHAELAAVDPAAAAVIPPNNVRRVVRALEVHQVSGAPISSFWQVRSAARRPACVLVCDRPREVLAARIAARVAGMLRAGLVDEVRGLLARGVPPGAQALQALGYKETVAWLREGGTPADLEQAIVRATRRYAKRQRTWWRAEPRAQWLDLGEGPVSAAVPRVLAAWRAWVDPSPGDAVLPQPPP